MLPDIDLAHYRYHLPQEKIALYPVSPRDASKLLVCSEGVLSHRLFHQLPAYVPPDTLMVFNQTKVIRARLLFHTSTGAQVEVFCLEAADGVEQVSALSATQAVHWKCFVGHAKKWKEEVLQLRLTDKDRVVVLHARMEAREEDHYRIRFDWTPEALSWGEVLALAGKMPLPPYIKREADVEDEENYQTVYASIQGSVAAPTAGLHFTDRVLKELEGRGVQLAYTTLHVGAGTFKPVKAAFIRDHDMHAEELIVEKKFVGQLLAHSGKPVLAVGTTSVRCIESLYWLGVKMAAGVETVSELSIAQWDPYNLSTSTLTPAESLSAIIAWMEKRQLEKISLKTSIIIVPGYSFRFVNLLITNFHQPESTLILLIAAFAGKNWTKIYQYALENDFRFLSYGDSSLLSRDCL